MDYSLPGSFVHGISQATILEWVAISFSRDLPDPGIEPTSPALAGRFFTSETLGKSALMEGALQNLQPLNPASQPAPLSPKPWERYKTLSFKRSDSWGESTHVQDEQGLRQHQSKGMVPSSEP